MSTKIYSGEKAKHAQPFAWGGIQPADAAPSAQLQPNIESFDLERMIEARARQAFEAGRREGETAAQQKLSARVDALVVKLAQTIQELSAVRSRIRREAEGDLVQLSLAVARKILNREIQTDQDALLGVVKAALERVESREIFRVRVCPSHADSLRRALENLGMPQRIEVQPDARLETGAVIFDTAQGSLDVSIETQLREIERGLADMVKNQ